MPKIITSKSKTFTGTITLKSPLTWPDYMVVRRCMDQVIGEKRVITAGEIGNDDEKTNAMIPGICACVEKWELEKFPPVVAPETFPATPRKAVAGLVVQLTAEIFRLIDEAEDTDPNA